VVGDGIAQRSGLLIAELNRGPCDDRLRRIRHDSGESRVNRLGGNKQSRVAVPAVANSASANNRVPLFYSFFHPS